MGNAHAQRLVYIVISTRDNYTCWDCCESCDHNACSRAVPCRPRTLRMQTMEDVKGEALKKGLVIFLLMIFAPSRGVAIQLPTLQCVSETFKALDDFAAGIRALVRHPKLQVHEQCDDHNQPCGNHASGNTGHIVWSILGTEDCSANDSTDTSCTDKSSRTESTLPLATNIVRLPCEDTRYVRVGSSSG
jgi:hypothetical protein